MFENQNLSRLLRLLMKLTACLCFVCVLSACQPQQAHPRASSADKAQLSKDSGVTHHTQIELLTYNVLADPEHADERVDALIEILEEEDADIVALQEVAPWFLAKLEEHDWVRQRYNAHNASFDQAPGGLFVLSRFPIKKHHYEPLPSRQGRGALIVDIDAPGGVLRVATVHLDSPLGWGDVRAAQLELIFERLEGASNAVLLGDFNFGDGEQPETRRLREGYIDPWALLYPEEPGFTWNMEASAMARYGAFEGEKSRRLDRILMRHDRAKPVSVDVLGDQAVSVQTPGIFPSDHFGVTATFELR